MDNGQLGIIVGVMVVLQILAVVILKAILQGIVKFEFRKREQAAMIASLFAEWISCPEDTKELNRLAWEASLWLPDNIAQDVNKRLVNASVAKDIRQIIVDVKGLIQGGKSKLDPNNIVYFPKNSQRT